jgi:SynChlorMet cassette protein ScmD
MTGNPAANPIIVLREEFDNYGLLFDPDTGGVLVINPIGVSIWKLMDGKRDIDGIVREIGNLYEDVSAEAPKEIEAFIIDLANRGFVGSIIDSIKKN